MLHACGTTWGLLQQPMNQKASSTFRACHSSNTKHFMRKRTLMNENRYKSIGLPHDLTIYPIWCKMLASATLHLPTLHSTSLRDPAIHMLKTSRNSDPFNRDTIGKHNWVHTSPEEGYCWRSSETGIALHAATASCTVC